jgi:hypothetical protein
LVLEALLLPMAQTEAEEDKAEVMAAELVGEQVAQDPFK